MSETARRITYLNLQIHFMSSFFNHHHQYGTNTQNHRINIHRSQHAFS